MFADDICLFYKYKYERVLQAEIEYDAAILEEFARLNKLVLNSAKTKFIRFRPHARTNEEDMVIHVGGSVVSESKVVQYLGIQLSYNLLWDAHIDKVKAKISAATGVLYKFRNTLNIEVKLMIYQSLIHSNLTYLPLIYACHVTSSLKKLQSAQNKALKTVYNLPMRYSTVDLYKYKAQNILPVCGLYKQQLLLYVFKSIRGFSPKAIEFHQNIGRTGRNTRQAHHLQIARCRIELTKQRIAFAGPSEYNNLPVRIKNMYVISSFKHELKLFLLNNLETLLF